MFQTKEIELNSFLSSIPPSVSSLSVEEKDDLDEKVKSLQDQWMKLKSLLESRIRLAKSYVNFHSKAVDLSAKYDSMENNFKKRISLTSDDIKLIEEDCLLAQESYSQLRQAGENFIEDSRKVIFNFFSLCRLTNGTGLF